MADRPAELITLSPDMLDFSIDTMDEEQLLDCLHGFYEDYTDAEDYRKKMLADLLHKLAKALVKINKK